MLYNDTIHRVSAVKSGSKSSKKQYLHLRAHNQALEVAFYGSFPRSALNNHAWESGFAENLSAYMSSLTRSCELIISRSNTCKSVHVGSAGLPKLPQSH